jgi:Domain of unknown function (DUF6894)
MPRYFFNVSDGADLPDVEGIVLQDRAAARTQAITTAGEMLKERGCTFWHGTEWRMTVLDEAGTHGVLASLHGGVTGPE